MAFFVGEYPLSIDGKHRLAIPAGLRDGLDTDEDGKKFILVVGPDRHLWLYPEMAYRQMMAQMRQGPLPDRNRAKISLMFAMARVVKPDKQGRIVLPEKSRERARIASEVTLVGDFDHIVIWPTEEWDAHVAEQMEGYGEAIYEQADRLNEPESQQ